MLHALVRDEKLTLPQAAQYAEVSEAEFEEGFQKFEAAQAAAAAE